MSQGNLIHPKFPNYKYVCSLDGEVCVERECSIMKYPGCLYCGALPKGTIVEDFTVVRVVYDCGMTAEVETDEVFYFTMYRGCSMVLDTDYFFVVRENKLKVEEDGDERTHQKV